MSSSPTLIFFFNLYFYLSCFHLLTIVTSAGMNIGVQVSLWVPVFSSFGVYVHKWNSCRTVFLSGSTILHPYQQYTRVPISPHSHQHLFSLFLKVAISVSARWYLYFFKSISFLFYLFSLSLRPSLSLSLPLFSSSS